jgi:hypothetical protein
MFAKGMELLLSSNDSTSNGRGDHMLSPLDVKRERPSLLATTGRIEFCSAKKLNGAASA